VGAEFGPGAEMAGTFVASVAGNFYQILFRKNGNKYKMIIFDTKSTFDNESKSLKF
jgi:hypothetical protein